LPGRYAQPKEGPPRRARRTDREAAASVAMVRVAVTERSVRSPALGNDYRTPSAQRKTAAQGPRRWSCWRDCRASARCSWPQTVLRPKAPVRATRPLVRPTSTLVTKDTAEATGQVARAAAAGPRTGPNDSLARPHGNRRAGVGSCPSELELARPAGTPLHQAQPGERAQERRWSAAQSRPAYREQSGDESGKTLQAARQKDVRITGV